METTNLVNDLTKVTMAGSEWVLWLLIALSLLSVVVMVERAVYMRSNRIKNFNIFARRMSVLLHKDHVAEAITLCKGEKGIEARVAQIALENWNMGAEAIEKATLSIMGREKQNLERGIFILGTLGSNSPFIGLLGTVLGIIKAFHDLSVNAAGGSSVVMAGISEALVATAIGLVVAIPAVVAFNIFQRTIKKRIGNCESIQQMILSYMVSEQNKNRYSAA